MIRKKLENINCSIATSADIKKIKNSVYQDKVVVLEKQSLSPEQYLEFGKRFGEPEEYYHEIYHHQKVKEIFVSSNAQNLEGNHDGVGVPKTGKFWHSDYAFMQKPFGITILYFLEMPNDNRGTYFIDMGEAYQRLSTAQQCKLSNSRSYHSPRRYVKIKPTDVYKPVSEVLTEIEKETPPVSHPTLIVHPVTKEVILYISEATTFKIVNSEGDAIEDAFLKTVLEETGQFDDEFSNPLINFVEYKKGDIVLFDNRSLIHCAKHVPGNELSVSHRLTIHDEYPFYSKYV